MDDNTPLTFFSPATPIPRVWDPARRLQGLRDCLNPNSPGYHFVVGMHDNIRAAIAAYESGQMPTQGTVYFKYGRRVTEAEGKVLDDYVWREVCGFFLRIFEVSSC